MRQERARHAHHAPEIDVEQPLEIAFGDLIEGPVERDAGVVDKKVDEAVRGEHGFGQSGDARAVGHVEPMQADREPTARGAAFGLEKARFADVGERQTASAAGERDGNRPSDPACGVGHQGDAAAEVHARWHGTQAVAACGDPHGRKASAPSSMALKR